MKEGKCTDLFGGPEEYCGLELSEPAWTIVSG